MRMLKAIAIGVALLMPATGYSGEIIVQGTGEVAQAPDMATISLGARFAAKSADEALGEVNERTAAVIATLKAMGIEAKHIQTSGLYLDPVWDDSKTQHGFRRIRGYTAGNTLTITVLDLAILGDVLDEVVADGANAFNGLQFGLQDESGALNEARRRAVEDARAKAELYAETAGVSLGAIVSITEGGVVRPQPMMMERAAFAMADSVPIEAGEVATRAEINITYEIAEPDAE